MAKKIIGTDGQADQRGKSHSIVLRAVLLCAGLVLAGCGTQEDGQAESRQEEQMKGQSEERSDEKPEGQPEEKPEGQSEGRLEDQAGESGAPVFEISPKLLEYRGMTYGEFQEESMGHSILHCRRNWMSALFFQGNMMKRRQGLF